MSHRLTKWSAVAALLAGAACGPSTPAADTASDSPAAVAAANAPSSDPAADEAAIRARSKAWLAAQQQRNVDSVMSYYVDDAIAVYDGKLLSGRGEVRTNLEREFATAAKAHPDMTYSWETTSVGVASAGDLAFESGQYDYAWGGGKSHDRGYYITVWRKVDGQWKVVRDMTTPDSVSMKQR